MGTKSWRLGIYFILTATLQLYNPHFKLLKATCGQWLVHWTVKVYKILMGLQADLCQEEVIFTVLWEHRGRSSQWGKGLGGKASQRRWHLNWALKDE